MSSQTKITLYDIDSNLPGRSFSPFVFMIRIILSLKKVPFELHHSYVSDIETVAKSINAPPSGKKLDGSGHYTVPFIKIESEGRPTVALSGTDTIAKYLDETYPVVDQPLFPTKDRVLHSMFAAWFFEKLVPNVMTACVPDIHANMRPEDVQWYHDSRRAITGKPAADPDEETLAKAREAAKVTLTELAAHCDKAGQGNNRLTGGAITYAEIQLVGLLRAAKAVNGAPWEVVQEVAGGRFAELLQLPEYDV